MAEEFIARPVQTKPSSAPPVAFLEEPVVKELEETQTQTKTTLSNILTLLKSPFTLDDE